MLDAGHATQSGAQFTYPSFTGFDPSVGFPLRGQFVLFSINAIVVGSLGTSNVTIDFDGEVYTLTGLSGRAVPLEEFKPHTEYFALGRGLNDLILIGPNDLLEDDVLDVTNTGLPPLDIDNYKKIFIDHDSPRAWIGHREIIAATPAVGAWFDYTNPQFRGAFDDLRSATNPQVGEYLYYHLAHQWYTANVVNGIVRFRSSSFESIFSGVNGVWLGEQPDDGTAVDLIDNFTTSNNYYFFLTGSEIIRVLNTATFVPAVGRIIHYVAEPISAPTGVGSIAGVTAA